MKQGLSIKTTIKNLMQSNYRWGVIAIVIVLVALYFRPSVVRTNFVFDVETSLQGDVVGYPSHEISPGVYLGFDEFDISYFVEDDYVSRFYGTFSITNASDQGVLLGGFTDLFIATVDPTPNRVTDDDEFVIVPARTLEILSREGVGPYESPQVVETIQFYEGLTTSSHFDGSLSGTMLGRYLPAYESIYFRAIFVPSEHDATNEALFFPVSSRQEDARKFPGSKERMLSVLSDEEQQQLLEGDLATMLYWIGISDERRAKLPKDDDPYLQDEFVGKFKVFVEYYPVATEGIKELESRLGYSVNKTSWVEYFLENSRSD